MAINLAEYEKMETPRGVGNFIKFEKTGDTKYLRFMYTSGGSNMGSDVTFRRKKWDDSAKKFIYDGEDGQLVCALECIEYDEGGGNPRWVRWEKSAYFCKTVLLPMWKNFPRICDGVWKVSATSPKTIEASYALFPVLGADTISYPVIDKPEQTAKAKVASTASNAPQAEPVAKPKKKYWEN